MLLNLSNHPSHNWPANQLKTALQQYETIHDIPFPQIDPHSTTEQVHQLAQQYCRDIISQHPPPITVHLMGELTFTHVLVTKLTAAGIPCIASTTERIIKFEQDGTKHSTFRFVRFRAY